MEKTIENLCDFQKDMWYWAFLYNANLCKMLASFTLLGRPQTHK
jgi:hypothetical protein